MGSEMCIRDRFPTRGDARCPDPSDGARTPVVSTDCDFGPAELLEDGQAGLLVPVGDAKAMAAAITALIDDSEGAMALAAAARIRVQEFEVALATAGYEQVLIEASEREGMPV